MTLLIDYLQDRKNEHNSILDKLLIKSIIQKAEGLLEIEEQQIKTSYDEAQKNCVNLANNAFVAMGKPKIFEFVDGESQNYYDKKYKENGEE